MDYEKIYDNLVSYRRENVLDESNCEYYETHHIVPRSIDKKLIYKKTNKVNLTVREHFVAHLLLKRIYKKKFGEDSYQYRAMVKTCFLFANKHKDVTINSRIIEKLRIAYKKLPSPMKGRPMSDNAKKALHKANIGRKHTKEHRQKILESRIKNGNNKLSEEHKQILIESRLGSKHTEETKERIRQKKLGFRHTEESKKKIGEAASKFMSGRKLPKEVCENIRKSKSGEKNPNFGKKWMFNEQTNHRLCVKIEEIEEYKKMGYKLGKNGKGGISHYKKQNFESIRETIDENL